MNSAGNFHKKIAVLFLFLVVIIGLVVYNYSQYSEQNETIKHYQEQTANTAFYFDGMTIRNQALLHKEQEQTLIALSFVQDYLPAGYTIRDKQLWFIPYQLDEAVMSEYWRNQFNFMNYQLSLPLLSYADDYYIDLQFLPLLCNFKLVEEGEVLQLYSADYQVYYSFLENDSDIYYSPKLKFKAYQLKAGDKVFVTGIADEHYQIIDMQGRLGYINKNLKALVGFEQYKLAEQLTESKQLYGKLQTTFNHITNYQAELNYQFSDKIEGLDQIIITAFSLNSDGSLENRIDKHYVNHLKSLGYQTVAMLDNRFQAELTDEFLKNKDAQKRMIDSLIFYLKYYQLDGINIDFENVFLEDKTLLTEFLSDLANALHQNGGSLSVDATRPGGSERWSRFLDRAEVAKIADYIVFMAYDQHWASSPVAGSVATLPWTESGIEAMLQLVPKEKLILAVPSYTRSFEVESANSNKALGSKAIAMASQVKHLKDKLVTSIFDQEAGQTLYQYQDREGKFYKLWAEDESSLTARLDLLLKYDLAGLASWRMGLESDDFWQITATKIK